MSLLPLLRMLLIDSYRTEMQTNECRIEIKIVTADENAELSKVPYLLHLGGEERRL